MLHCVELLRSIAVARVVSWRIVRDKLKEIIVCFVFHFFCLEEVELIGSSLSYCVLLFIVEEVALLGRACLRSLRLSLPEIARERTPGERVPGLLSPNFFLLLHALTPEGSNIERNLLPLGVELCEIDFDILDLILIFFELGIGLLLRIEMGEHFVIDPQLEGLALLYDIQREAVEVERILEGHIRGELILEEDLAIDRNFDLSREEREIEHDAVGLVPERDLPTVSLLAALDVLPHLLDVEPQRLNLLHLN